MLSANLLNTWGLNSVIRTFEEEISQSGTRPGSPKLENFIKLTSDSGESLSKLGQLLGYGDLEAPAAGYEGFELLQVSSESSGIAEFWDFQDELPSYDSFEFGMGYVEYNNSNLGQGDNDEYLALDGIFDFSDVNFGSDGNPKLYPLCEIIEIGMGAEKDKRNPTI
ncbi:hypothetical protein Cgig2_000922 [Carnegiea gigantea]|uniref:Uncharacterized protein n=1 Tax=Carnegiea gigantea TaxID=171969 RepID=A0A9Q1KND2_9CARY|nr:hypothetical protein Cgig2_000922 [Carnegiea gigantea]